MNSIEQESVVAEISCPVVTMTDEGAIDLPQRPTEVLQVGHFHVPSKHNETLSEMLAESETKNQKSCLKQLVSPTDEELQCPSLAEQSHHGTLHTEHIELDLLLSLLEDFQREICRSIRAEFGRFVLEKFPVAKP